MAVEWCSTKILIHQADPRGPFLYTTKIKHSNNYKMPGPIKVPDQLVKSFKEAGKKPGSLSNFQSTNGHAKRSKDLKIFADDITKLFRENLDKILE